VEKPHAQTVARSLSASNITVDVLVVASGEPTKSVAVAEQMWQKLLARGAGRKTVVVAVGGGVVGDLAGFVAATFARGVPYVQVPTTLLAQVDSSVGGKVAVNLPGAKNMVGAFWQPAGVLIDTDTLKTLPEREYRSGLAEVVKYGVILDATFFAYLGAHAGELLSRRHSVLHHAIERCCRLKADVVQADECETSGQRAVLNYGHTFAHALEAVTGYGQLLHGEAVAIGMMCAARLAREVGRVDDAFCRRQHALLVALGLPVALPEVDETAFLAAMQHDKKTEHGRLRFVLPSALGKVELVADVDPVAARAALHG
jgi:3-dehydroquinate synthase